MGNLIRRVNCVETPSGFLLTWDIAEGVEIRRTTVYGLNGSKQFVIEHPCVPTRRVLLAPSNYNLLNAFKLAVVDVHGDTEESDPISPQRMKKAERLLLNDIRRRNRIYLKSSPIGSYPCRVLFRRIDGMPCERCGSIVCSGKSGDAVSEYCPICLGTGTTDPFIAYPRMELFHGVSPADDKPVSQPDVQRSHVIRTFSTVFDLGIHTDDVFVSGTEVYKVLKQDVGSSIGGVPVNYIIQAIKVPPEDPKYESLITIAKACNDV